MNNITEIYLRSGSPAFVREEMIGQIDRMPDEKAPHSGALFVSADGDDSNDGFSPERPVRTLEKLAPAAVSSLGVTHVFFRRGDVFRGSLRAAPGITYSAYGYGEKPAIYGSPRNLADPALWERAGGTVWRLKERIPDCGTLFFDDSDLCSRKLIPSFDGQRFVHRDNRSVPFDLFAEMTHDLDLFCRHEGGFTEKPSKGENFPVPDVPDNCPTTLFLRCDAGNPGKVFESIESLPRRPIVKIGSENGVTLSNLRLMYGGTHAVAAGGVCVRDLRVEGCVIGRCGGAVQHYFGTDPNHPAGRRGEVTRFGNGVEIYGGCDGYSVENCRVFQIYDAGVTHQITTNGREYIQKNVLYRSNLIENCTYGIEYFLDRTQGDESSRIEGCLIENNMICGSGYGWGAQRHNIHTPALIKSWDFCNEASDFSIRDNLFGSCTERPLHINARERSSLPVMSGNLFL